MTGYCERRMITLFMNVIVTSFPFLLHISNCNGMIKAQKASEVTELNETPVGYDL